jgi:hypothetical protein
MDTATNGLSDDELEAEPMDVEDNAVYAKRHDDDMEVSGLDKGGSDKMANDDWNQLGETYKAKSNKKKFVRGASKTYQKAKRSDLVPDYVKECRTLLVSMAISDPDFGFGVDPGRLRGYPLAHLAGTWW